MQNVQNMDNFLDYTKCGEILKPPSRNYQRPYILKCLQCKKIFLLYEAFLFHIEDDCKSLSTESKINKYYDPNITKVHCGEVHSELDGKNHVNIKNENSIAFVKEDPLNNSISEFFSKNDQSASVNRNLSSSDNINNTPNNDGENNLLTDEDLCEQGSMEVFNNSDEYFYQSSEGQIENVSDELTEEEDEAYEIKTVNGQKYDFNSRLESSNFVAKFLTKKDYVIGFIEAFKRQPSLWNKNYPYLRTTVDRQNCFQKLADEFNEQHDFFIYCTEVRNFTVYLCRNYREDLKYMAEIKDTNKNYTPSWFFEHLNFLKPFMEKNHIASIDSHLPDLLPTQIIEILRIYKELPQLWNTQIIEHYCKNKMEAAKQDMLQALETNLDIKITEHVLEKYIRTINNCFKRAKRNKLNKKPDKNISGTSTEESKLEDYYEYMVFLKDHVGRFNCSECKRPFKNPMYLKIHQNNAHGFEPFPCSQCKKPFKSVTAYTNHAKRHMKDLNYGCKECDKKFLYSKELEIHMRRHNEIKPFCCEICGVSFRHIQTFKTHHRRHIKNYLHTCKICGKGFYTKDRYTDHMNSHSNTRNQTCTICGKAFITKRSLQQHVVIHDDIRRYSCKLCGKTFKQKTGVNQHMRTHGITNSEEKNAAKWET